MLPSLAPAPTYDDDRRGGFGLEAITLVCDVCGKPAAETVTIKVGTRNYVKGLCSQHLGELLQGARAPRRGRPKVLASGRAKSVTTPTNGRKKRAGRKKTTARRPKSKKTGARRATPRKSGRPSSS